MITYSLFAQFLQYISLLKIYVLDLFYTLASFVDQNLLFPGAVDGDKVRRVVHLFMMFLVDTTCNHKNWIDYEYRVEVSRHS